MAMVVAVMAATAMRMRVFATGILFGIRSGIGPAVTRLELASGEGYPDFETWDRISTLFGWSQTFEQPTDLAPSSG